MLRILMLLAAVLGPLGPYAAAQSRQPAGIDDRTSLGWATDDAGSYLTADATSVATTWTVADTASFEVDNILTVQATGEKAHVTAISSGAPGTLTVVRGVGGTTPLPIVHGNTDTTGVINCNVNSTYWRNSLDALNKTELHLAAVAAASLIVLELNGTPVSPQRPNWNFVPGTGVTITCPDNPGAGSTDCTISAPGAAGSGFAIQVDGAAQPTEPTVSFDHGAGILLTPSAASGVLHVQVEATGSGSGTKPTYVEFSAAGCVGGSGGAAIDLPATGAPTVACHTAGNLNFGTLDFASGGNQTAQIHYQLPEDWTPASTMRVQLSWYSSVGSGSTAWSAKTYCAPEGSVPLTGTVSFNAAGASSTANNATPLTMAETVWAGISMAGCAPGLEVWTQFQRTDSAGGVASVVSLTTLLSRTY